VPWPNDAPAWLVREVGDNNPLFKWSFQEERFAPYHLKPIPESPDDANPLLGLMAVPRIRQAGGW
jgi:hypothetical protein